MAEQLQIEVVRVPRPEAEREIARGLDLLAEGLADLYIARARSEVARELGVAEEAIDREHGRELEDAVRSCFPFRTQQGEKQ